MKLYEIKTQCGAKIQTGKLTKQEQNPVIALTFCPVVCPSCNHPHGLEVCCIKEVEVNE
jgi:hypothetical protein